LSTEMGKLGDILKPQVALVNRASQVVVCVIEIFSITIKITIVWKWTVKHIYYHFEQTK